ncbi:MAG TPA: hemerythrin domain-containing protein [Myxococcaceae bacterium]|nr:hemerythrin domain-containing protein [Myxococcaceae bacterium]
MELSASQVRSLILDEHAVLRDVLQEIEETLGEMTRRVPGAIRRLRASLRTLQDAFLRHLAHEESVLRPLLADVDAWGPARVEAMDEEHKGQRAALAELSRLALDEDVDGTVQQVEEFVRRLRGDMDGEEHHALSEEVLRDDIIVIDTFMG